MESVKIMSYKNRSKIRQKLVSLFLGLSLLFNIFAPLTAVIAEDVPPPMAPVTSWQLLDANNQAVSEDNPVKVEEAYALQAEVHLQGLEGAKLAVGSVYQVKLPVNATVGAWSAEQATPKELVNKIGEVVGSFVINNQTIFLTLNEAVTDLDQVDAVIQTDAVLKTDVAQDVTQAVQVGNISQTLAFEGTATEPTPELAKVKPALRAATAPVDYSNQVVVNDWNLINSTGPLSLTNPGTHNFDYSLKFDWTLTPVSATLNEGDTFSFYKPTMAPSGSFTVTSFDWSDFTDSSGIVLGKWRIYNNRIEVVLGANVTGKQSITGEFLSGLAFKPTVPAGGGDFNVSFGGIVKVIKINRTSALSTLGNDVKYRQASSNTYASWGIQVGNIETIKLGQSFGTAYDSQTGVYVEDFHNGTPATMRLASMVYLPVDLSTGVLSTAGLQMNIPLTKISQIPGESYMDFKARLGVYQYGYYQDDFGQYTSVLYLGELGVDGAKYSDLDPNFASAAATSIIDGGYYQESERPALEAFVTDVYGDSNVIGGKVAAYTMGISETFPQVISNTTITNTARITKSGNTRDVSANATLSASVVIRSQRQSLIKPKPLPLFTNQ